jgi:hypothetical protein
MKNEKLEKLFTELKQNNSIGIKKLELNKQPAADADIEYVKGRKTANTKFLQFYSECNGITIDWQAKKDDSGEVAGKVKLLPFNQAIVNWKGVVYFDDTPEDDLIRRFFIIDFFIDEACSGFYATTEQSPDIYYYPFEGEPFNLELDINGYVEMLIEAKGFRYWQLALKELITKSENHNSKIFKTHMPVLFPDFKFKDFEQKFNSLRLHK